MKNKIIKFVANLKNHKRFKTGIVFFSLLAILSSGIYIYLTFRQMRIRIGVTPEEIRKIPFTCTPLTIVSLKDFAENANEVKPLYGEKCQFENGLLMKLIYEDSKQALKAKLGLTAVTEGEKKEIDGLDWIIKDKNSSLFLTEGNRLGIFILLGETGQSKIKNYLELGRKILRQEMAVSANGSSGSCKKINFEEGWERFDLTKNDTKCLNFIVEANSNNYKIKCRNADARWRSYLVKEEDVKNAKNVTIKADLELVDQAKFFEESGGIGVKYDNYVELLVYKEGLREPLQTECNRTATEEEWSSLCSIEETGSSVLGSCGVPKYTQSQECNLQLKTEDLDKIYLVFKVVDAWPADVEGSLNNLEICHD